MEVFQQTDKVEERNRAGGEKRKQGGSGSLITAVGCAGVCDLHI